MTHLVGLGWMSLGWFSFMNSFVSWLVLVFRFFSTFNSNEKSVLWLKISFFTFFGFFFESHPNGNFSRFSKKTPGNLFLASFRFSIKMCASFIFRFFYSPETGQKYLIAIDFCVTWHKKVNRQFAPRDIFVLPVS